MMKTMRKKSMFGAALGVVALAAVAAVLLAPAADASPAQCDGVVSGTVAGNLVVPDGAGCILAGAHVQGNVAVGAGAWLHAVSDSAGAVSTIDGNVTGSDVQWVLLQDETQVGGNFVIDGASTFYTGFDINVSVGGNATITDNAGYTFVDAAIVGRNVDVEGATGGMQVEWNRVGGNETVSGNATTTMSVYGNQVAGNLDVSANTGGGHKQVIDNTAGRNLTCFGNDTPFVTSANTAQSAQGQCA